ncbi:calcium/proton exchanger [Pholiota conissans]|uniref:Calcium/proton exchanger n=1 Tax=Pholiota conissans TaxID=109636 RepID=A0A9P6CXW2_9AGAR|nr:calcium/proton exchanger [Pholiota conissans]
MFNSTATAQPNQNARQRTGSRFEIFRQRTKSLLQPPRKVAEAPSSFESLKAIILSSWMNMLLVFIPVSWALHFALPHSFANRDTIIFVFSFLAIIPLAKLLGFATEELAMRVGQTLAGLLNATLGNAVELIVAIIALVKCELRVVQASLVGSILSNLLLVLGMCFFAGGLKYSEQGFGVSATQLNSSLLTISVIAVLLPAAFHFSSSNSDTGLSTGSEGKAILSVSHGVAIILLFIYAGYLTFQLWSHPDLYQDKGIHSIESTKYDKPLFQGLHDKIHHIKHDRNGEASNSSSSPTYTTSPPHSPNLQSVQLRTNTFGSSGAAMTDSFHTSSVENPSSTEKEEEEIPTLSLWMTVILLVVVTTLVAITAEFLVTAIDGMTETGPITKEFVGIILLPIVGNAAEHVTAVTVSVKDKLNLSLGVAVGSSIQIALFVIPFIVTLAWILGKPLTLLFDPYESISMFLAVLTVNYVVQDGKSNWLEGYILMSLYLILAVTFWFYPGLFFCLTVSNSFSSFFLFSRL